MTSGADLTCDEVREMAGAFVLGALDSAEEASVRAHLETCTDAHAEIAELGGVLPVLAESVPVAQAPARPKPRIMGAADPVRGGLDRARHRGCRRQG